MIQQQYQQSTISQMFTIYLIEHRLVKGTILYLSYRPFLCSKSKVESVNAVNGNVDCRRIYNLMQK